MNIKRISFLLLVSWAVAFCMTAQTAATAADHFDNRRYVEAAQDYAALLERNPRNNLYLYRYARCQYELGEWEQAIHYFEAAGEKYPLRNYYLALLYYDAYRFSEAAMMAQKYRETLALDDERQVAIQALVDSVETAQNFFRRIEAVRIIDSVTVDKAHFLSVYQISPEAGHLQADTVGVCYTNQRNDRKHFARMQNGNIHLYVSQKLLDSWSKPQPLPEPVNTLADQNYPYILSDGITLYYASKGKGSLGGYDIFLTRYNSVTDAYLNPENVGMPFNSPANDYMMVIDEYNDIGWFATDRQQPEGKVMVYSFVPQEEKRYIDTSDPDTLRLYARLQLYEKANTVPLRSKPLVSQEPVTQSNEGEGFVIGAGRVYHVEADFYSPEARELYRLYIQNSDTIMQLNAHIRQLRRTYAELSAGQKTTLVPAIMASENRLYTLQQTTKKQEAEIRNMENSYLQATQP